MFRHIYVSDIAGPSAAPGAFVLGMRWPDWPAYSQGEGGSVTAQAVTDGALCTPARGGCNAGVEDAGNGAVAMLVTSAIGWGVVTWQVVQAGGGSVRDESATAASRASRTAGMRPRVVICALPFRWRSRLFVLDDDNTKSAVNLQKHGLDFVDAQALWSDPDVLEIPAKKRGR